MDFLGGGIIGGSIPQIVLVGDTSARTNYWSQSGQNYNVTSGDKVYLESHGGYYRDVVNKFVKTPQGNFFLVDTGNNSTACKLVKTSNFKSFNAVSGSIIDIRIGVLFYYNLKLYIAGERASSKRIDLYESSDYGVTWTFNKIIFTGSSPEIRGGFDSVDNVVITSNNASGANPSYSHVIVKSSLAVTSTIRTNPYNTLNIIRNFGAGAGSNKVRAIGDSAYFDTSSSGVLAPVTYTSPYTFSSIDYNAALGLYVGFGNYAGTSVVASYSSDLVTWTSCTVPSVAIAANSYYSIISVPTGFVASYVGGTGSPTKRGIWHSSDGITFTSVSTSLYGFVTTTRME